MGSEVILKNLASGHVSKVAFRGLDREVAEIIARHRNLEEKRQFRKRPMDS